MLTKYITGVTTTFSPFNARSGKTARNFLALLPPNARSTMAIDVKMLGRNATMQPASLALKFSTLMRETFSCRCLQRYESTNNSQKMAKKCS